MTVREKLVVLINKGVEIHTDGYQRKIAAAETIANHLIANGVTVLRWIPVTERLPKPIDPVLCIGTRGGMFIGYHCYSIERSMDKSICFRVPNSRRDRYASHWQPLPELPKEETK